MTDTTQIRKLITMRNEMTPMTGANLVREDDFEEDGEQLYLIGHYATEAEANAAMDEEKAAPDYNGDRLYVYLPPGAARSRPIDYGYTPEVLEGTWEDWDREEEAALRAREGIVIQEGAHHPSTVVRTDDWNEELHPRTPAGGSDGGEFQSGGGGGGGGGTMIRNETSSGGGGGTNNVVGLHRLATAKVNPTKVLEKAGLPKEKLFTKDEPPFDPERSAERAALAKVLVLKDTPEAEKHDEEKHGAYNKETGEHKLGADAQRVVKEISPEHFEALRKYSNRYDFAMKQVEGGADHTKLAEASEKFWTKNLAERSAEKGGPIDVSKMSAADKAQTFQKHFGHASGADFVATASQATDHVNDMFAKTAPTPGVAYRGMNNIPPNDIERILNSKTMTLDTMSSFSFDHGVGHDYATGAQASKAAGTSAGKTAKFGEDKVLPNGVQVVMRMAHKSGVNMMGASDFKKEQEVLLPKGTKFKLTNVTREGNFDANNMKNNDPPIIVVHMEEI